MTAKRITKSAVDRLEKGETIWDSQVKGFGVRRQKSAKSFILKYRYLGRQRTLTIGRYGSPWTVEMARKEALQLLAQVVRDIDPAHEKQLR